VCAPLEFRCGACGVVHRGLPAWHFQAPLPALAIPEAEWETRVELTDDDCVIDGEAFFLKGLLEVPVHGVSEPLTWGVWLSVSDASYQRFVRSFDDPTRPAGASYFGWLCNSVPGYPDTQLLKTSLHVREYPMRPWVELEPTEHPLAVDQRDGVARERAVAMAEGLLHPPGA
jgi:hypothetical protein